MPVFVMLMGYVGALTRTEPLLEYLRRRSVRLLVPLAITWFVSFAIYVYHGGRTFSPTWFIGVLPAAGPGNYCIAIIVQFVLLLPLLRMLHSKSPLQLVVVAAAADFTFEIAAWYFSLPELVYSFCILRYLFAVALGLWLASGRKTRPLLLV